MVVMVMANFKLESIQVPGKIYVQINGIWLQPIWYVNNLDISMLFDDISNSISVSQHAQLDGKNWMSQCEKDPPSVTHISGIQNLRA